MTKKTEVKTYPTRMLNLGLVETRSGIYLGLLRLDDEDNQGASKEVQIAIQNFLSGYGMTHQRLGLFDRKSRKNFAVVGAVYKVDSGLQDRSTIYPSTASFLHLWEIEGQRSALQGLDLTIRRHEDGKKRMAKLEKESDILTSLENARVAYQAARGTHRTQLLAAFVEYITK